ncbi:MAG: segregation/condensation protein A [Ardenticatenales bacterium]|nr:segregation/condensation protein A [Ardenticatenales bacterium]
MPNYVIELPAFAGPFDLLLHLIERNELDITAISLAQVTRQYLEQVEQLKQNKRVEYLIDFIVIGARLVLIKSRALLPQNPALGLEDEEEEDPAETLARQLRAYRQFKQLAEWLHRREEQGLRTYLRVAPPPKIESKLDLSGITPESLRRALQDVLARVEKSEESVGLVARRRITIEGQIDLLRRTVQVGRMGFHELLSPEVTKVEVCITLLAVLELIKRRELVAEQQEMFGPIWLTKMA